MASIRLVSGNFMSHVHLSHVYRGVLQVCHLIQKLSQGCDFFNSLLSRLLSVLVILCRLAAPSCSHTFLHLDLYQTHCIYMHANALL